VASGGIRVPPSIAIGIGIGIGFGG
jgi:hypothetical protein